MTICSLRGFLSIQAGDVTVLRSIGFVVGYGRVRPREILYPPSLLIPVKFRGHYPVSWALELESARARTRLRPAIFRNRAFPVTGRAPRLVQFTAPFPPRMMC
jgi:hypothetical protein